MKTILLRRISLSVKAGYNTTDALLRKGEAAVEDEETGDDLTVGNAGPEPGRTGAACHRTDHLRLSFRAPARNLEVTRISPCGRNDNPCGRNDNPCGRNDNPCGRNDNPFVRFL